MKRIMIASLALVFGLAVAAGAAAPKAASHAGTKSLTGCLEKGDEANTFKLTHVTGGQDWELMDAPASLKMSDHVGHKVEVSGSVMSTAAAAKAEKTTASKEAGEHHLKVTGLKHVAPTCP